MLALLREFHAHTVIVGLAGIISAVLLSRFGVKRIVAIAKDSVLTPPPAPVPDDEWQLAVHLDGAAAKPARVLGMMEASLFFLAFWLRAEIVAAGWLAFKVASKWEAWQSILKVPDSLDAGESPLGYLTARNRWGSLTLQTWLLGTLGNVLAGFAAVAIAKGVGLLLTRCGL